jgi:hypothetical protein
MRRIQCHHEIHHATNATTLSSKTTHYTGDDIATLGRRLFYDTHDRQRQSLWSTAFEICSTWATGQQSEIRHHHDHLMTRHDSNAQSRYSRQHINNATTFSDKHHTTTLTTTNASPHGPWHLWRYDAMRTTHDAPRCQPLPDAHH